MTRRELIAAATVPLAAAPQKLPASPVALARCSSYGEDLTALFTTLFDQAGIPGMVKNKTVTIKLNLTGSPALRFQGRPLGATHYTHPKTLAAMIHLLDKAGARRIRLVESCWGTGGPLEEYMLDAGWNVRQLQALTARLEFENTNARGRYKDYATLKVPDGARIFPSYTFNRAYVETDLMMSMAKLKNHATCGITLAMKNCFGNTPASIYGDDAGVDEPNERPTKGRLDVCHYGKRQPARIAAPELSGATPRVPEYRMTKISVEVVAARPVDISFIDGVETITTGEGPWVKGIQHVKPGVVILGTNMVCTDAVGTAVMGYDPRAPQGRAPFQNCENMLLLAEQMGLGSADLRRIEVRGQTIQDVRFLFPGADPV
jgi:uncharacterized protein (DUF362 family)